MVAGESISLISLEFIGVLFIDIWTQYIKFCDKQKSNVKINSRVHFEPVVIFHTRVFFRIKPYVVNRVKVRSRLGFLVIYLRVRWVSEFFLSIVVISVVLYQNKVCWILNSCKSSCFGSAVKVCGRKILVGIAWMLG